MKNVTVNAVHNETDSESTLTLSVTLQKDGGEADMLKLALDVIQKIGRQLRAMSPASPDRCPMCHGFGSVDPGDPCTMCDGTGETSPLNDIRTCHVCHGTGEVGPDVCLVCHGTGEGDGIECPYCDGTGKATPRNK